MRSVIYISRAGLPIDATGIRISAIGRILAKLGYDAHYVCERRVDAQIEGSGYQKLSTVETDKAQHFCLSKNEVHYTDNGFVYSYLQPHSGKKKDAVMDTIEIYRAKNAFLRVKEVAEKEHADIIILYNDVYGLTKRLIPYCRKTGITLLADVTEWYEKKKCGTLAEKMVVNLTDKRIRKLDRNLDGIFSISPYFKEYYEKLGVKTILVPPLMDIEEDNGDFVREKDENNEIKFVYAGSLGGKDIVVPFVKAVIESNLKERRLRVDLIGIGAGFLEQNGILGSEEKTGVYAHGRLSHEDALDYVRNADFGFLFRHNQRYAKAGFSTKFSECMSLGTAMVCNQIGGTDIFIENGVDGYVLKDINRETLAGFLEKLKAAHRSEIENMKKNARKKAKKMFCAENYLLPIKKFLDEVDKSECERKGKQD